LSQKDANLQIDDFFISHSSSISGLSPEKEKKSSNAPTL